MPLRLCYHTSDIRLMNGNELIKFLKLLRDSACLDRYWRNKINDVINKMGGTTNDEPPNQRQ